MKRGFVWAFGTVLGLAGAVWAAAGDLDSGYGNGGIATLSDPAGSQAFGLARQSSGKVLLAGHRLNHAWLVCRFDTDGSLDTTFGSAGTASVFADADLPVLRALALDGDDFYCGGRTRVALSSGGKRPKITYEMRGTVARLSANGALDTGFGTGGIVRLAMPGDIMGMQVQADGKLVVCGTTSIPPTRRQGSYQTAWFLARLTETGALDSGFGSGGITVYDATSTDDRLLGHCLAILPDGRIVVGGSTGGLPGTWTVARFSASGSYEASATRTDGRCTGVAIDAGGGVLALGYRMLGTNLCDAVVTRYLSGAGGLSVDTTFGTGGSTYVAVPDTDRFECYSGLAFGPNGEILASGAVVPTSEWTTTEAWTFRLTAAGALDSSFGTGGLSGPLGVSVHDAAYGIATDPSDGAVLVGGYAFTGAAGDPVTWFVARMLGN